MKLPKLKAPPMELVPICAPVGKVGKNLKHKSSRQAVEDEMSIEIDSSYYPNVEEAPASRLKTRLEKIFRTINFFAVLTLILSHILGIYLAVSFILLTTTAQDTDYEFFSSALNYIHDNTHSKFMQNVVAIDPTDSCPTDYQPLSFGQYEGTVQGCVICGVLVTGGCGFSSSCGHQAEVEAFPSQEIYIWQNKKLCVQYFTDIFIGAVCPAGYDQCGTGICVPQGSLCPITGVTTSLQFTRDTTSNPLVNLTIVSQTMPCLSLNQYPTRKNFALDENPGVGCGNYGTDPFAFLIQSANAQVILNQNGIWDQVSYVPGYQDFMKQITWNLVGRRLLDIQPRPECYELEFPELDDIDQAVGQNVGPGKTLAMISTIAVFLMSSVLICCAISDALMKDCYHRRRLREYWCGMAQRCFYLYDLLWIVSAGIIILSSGRKLYGPLDRLRDYDNDFRNTSTCFGKLISPVFLDYGRVFDSSIAPYSEWGKQSYFSGISIIVILSIFLVISILLRMLLKRLGNRV